MTKKNLLKHPDLSEHVVAYYFDALASLGRVREKLESNPTDYALLHFGTLLREFLEFYENNK